MLNGYVKYWGVNMSEFNKSVESNIPHVEPLQDTHEVNVAVRVALAKVAEKLNISSTEFQYNTNSPYHHRVVDDAIRRLIEIERVIDEPRNYEFKYIESGDDFCPDGDFEFIFKNRIMEVNNGRDYPTQ